MTSQSSPPANKRANHRYSFVAASGLHDVPISVFNRDLLKGLGKGVWGDEDDGGKGGEEGWKGKKRRRSFSEGQVHSRSSSLRIRLDESPEPRGRSRRSVSEQPTPRNTRIPKPYTRPLGPELVSPKHPSCSKLPPTWTSIHDRFIAYLATHAPLDRNGKIPRFEERRERWRSNDIVRLLGERFGGELGYNIKVSTIEKRLVLLDQAGDNDYFKIPYGAYRYEEWGCGI